MNTLRRTGFLLVLVAGLGSVASTAGGSNAVRDLPTSQLFTAAGKMTPLRSGPTYRASQFPIALRLTPPDGSWAGAQWKSGRLPAELAERLHKGDGGGPPNFGWVAVGHGGTSLGALPRGIVVIMTAYARTPAFSVILTRLRTRGHGAIYGPVTRVRIAGFPGVQFDGERILTAPNHIFVPFTKGGGFPSRLDAFQVYGPVFRVIALNVRGKTVVVFIDSVALTAEQFPPFLAKADQIIRTLRFPT